MLTRDEWVHVNELLLLAHLGCMQAINPDLAVISPRTRTNFLACTCCCAGVDLPSADYVHLDTALVAACSRFQLQPTDAFLDKARQLYEMVLVRHGLMLVGYSYGAKTSIYRWVLVHTTLVLLIDGLCKTTLRSAAVLTVCTCILAQLWL